jgi:hypothetical protein
MVAPKKKNLNKAWTTVTLQCDGGREGESESERESEREMNGTGAMSLELVDVHS